MRIISVMLIFFWMFFWIIPSRVFAASQSYVRLASMQTSDVVSGTLCHEPASESTLGVKSITIDFPADFIIDSLPATWTTDTASLPSGALAWPGIESSALAVSGTSVRFASSPLPSTSSLYCFHFQSTTSKISPSAGSKTFTLVTSSANGTSLETKRMALTVVDNDRITVTATVGENARNFPIALTKEASTEPAPQYTDIPFTITYGSDLSFPKTLRLEASWYAGQIDGVPGSTVDVLEYKNGSAQPGFGGAKPTVDLVNKKIIWILPSFPAKKKEQTVRFTLRTNAVYTGKRSVTSRINANLFTEETSVTASLTTSYLYSPTIQVSVLEPVIVTIRSIASDSATLHIESMDETIIRVLYGTAPDKLTHTTRAIQYAKDRVVNIPNLTHDTVYFFSVTATNRDGVSVSSDVYEFRTAQVLGSPQIDTFTLTFESGGLSITPSNNRAGATPAFSLPQGTLYNFRFKLQNTDDVKRVQGSVRSKHVLGITSEEIIQPTGSETTLFERQPGLFEGRLKSSEVPGTYEVVLTVSDFQGNLSENTIAEVYVSKRLTVINQQTGTPIEGAHILILYQNPRTRIFDPIPESIIPVKNPSYTDINGQISYPLPKGTYRAEITAIGFQRKNIDFILGQKPGEDYPLVSLHPQPFSLVTISRYYWTIVMDMLVSLRTYIQNLSRSIRFFEINALLSLLLLVFLTLLSFSARIKIPFHSLIEYVLHRTKIATIHKKFGERIKGRIFDEETGTILATADVFLIDADKNKVVGHTKTNQDGDFTFLKYKGQSYDLEVMNDGYEPIVFHESKIQSIELGGYLLSIRKHERGPTIREKTTLVMEKILSLFFETLLVASIVSETALGFALGWLKTAPFLLISLVNLSLWILHLTHLRSEKNIF